jgi:spore germination protein KC
MTAVQKMALSLCMMLTALTGCGNYMDLNELSIVMGIGVDRTKDLKYRVSLQIINPGEVATGQSSGGKSVPILLDVSEGRSLSEAIRNASKKITKMMEYSHVAVAVIGEEAAKEGINEIIDTLLREPRMTSNLPVLIAKDTTAEQVLKLLSPITYVSSMDIVQKNKNTQKLTGEAVGTTTILSIGENITHIGQNIAISGVALANYSKDNEGKANLEKTDPAETHLDAIALFNKDKLVGWLEGKQARGLVMVREELKETNITIPCKENNYTSLRIIGQNINSDVIMKNNQAHINIRGTMFAFLDETGCSMDLADMKVIDQIENDAGKAIEQMVRDSITTAQSYKSDAFGFGNMLAVRDKKSWRKVEKQWPELFQNAEIKVDYSVNIRRNGMINKPVFYK